MRASNGASTRSMPRGPRRRRCRSPGQSAVWSRWCSATGAGCARCGSRAPRCSAWWCCSCSSSNWRTAAGCSASCRSLRSARCCCWSGTSRLCRRRNKRRGRRKRRRLKEARHERPFDSRGPRCAGGSGERRPGAAHHLRSHRAAGRRTVPPADAAARHLRPRRSWRLERPAGAERRRACGALCLVAQRSSRTAHGFASGADLRGAPQRRIGGPRDGFHRPPGRLAGVGRQARRQGERGNAVAHRREPGQGPPAAGAFPGRARCTRPVRLPACLRRWRPGGDEEQLVRLAQGGQTIERMAVELGNLHARFLRLRWRDPHHGAPLAKVEIDSVQEVGPVAPIEWSGALKPERCAENYCDSLLPRALPLQSLRIDLADINTLAQVGVSGLVDATPASAPPPRFAPRNPLYALRHQQRRTNPLPSGPGEAPLLDTVVYRLAQAGGEARSPALALDGAVYSRLRLRTSRPVSVLGATPPTIAVGATPRTLVFLAQGGAPFSLAWSAVADKGAVQGAAPGAPLALSTLIPGHAADKPIAADDASVTLPVAAVQAVVAAATLAPVPATAPHDPSRKWWLWGALGIGLLALAGMAGSLFASLRKDRAAED